MPQGVNRIAGVMEGLALRAGHFIVTLYGDVVEPRGGRLWMGNIIETCAEVGISETLVRTAVSRLVAAGKLEGTRAGRKSYYALTEPTREEFGAASRILYDPPRREGWNFVMLPDGAEDAARSHLVASGFVGIAPEWWFGPGDTLPRRFPGLVFPAQVEAGAGLRKLVHGLWSLSEREAAYKAFTARFSPVLVEVEAGASLEEAQALVLRLLLVDRFRAIVLRDPLLPAEALPERWAGAEARRCFAQLYAALSPAADSHIARHFVSDHGALPCHTAATRRRVETLAK